MKIDLPDEYVPLIVKALEHFHAYSRAAQREDARYREAADWFKRKQPSSEESDRTDRTPKRKPLDVEPDYG
jgi:hypothetical protein